MTADEGLVDAMLMLCVRGGELRLYFCAFYGNVTRHISLVLMKIGSFASRHLGPRLEDQNAMLRTLGAPSLDDLIERTVPGAIRLRERLSVSKALTESEYLEHIDGLASQNTVFRTTSAWGITRRKCRASFAGMCWRTRMVHAYTPYQAEIAQGRLEALLNFQTMVMDLTGMEVANASLLDEGTAAAEAMAMLFAARPGPKSKRARTGSWWTRPCSPKP